MVDIPFLPAPIQQRHDGWTPARQWAFIQALADTASVLRAARIAGMSVNSAHRLRRHPAAAAFRAAWDAAVAQNWGRLEQVALDRAINGETETIERGGRLVAERHRPCSDRLLIELLRVRARQVETRQSEREAARRAAATAKRLARLGGAGEAVGEAVVAAVDGELAAESAALHDFHALTQGLPDSRGWDGPNERDFGDAEPPRLPFPAVLLAPADGAIVPRWRPTKLRLAGAETGEKARRGRG